MAGKKASANKEEVKKDNPRSKTPVKEEKLTKISSVNSQVSTSKTRGKSSKKEIEPPVVIEPLKLEKKQSARSSSSKQAAAKSPSPQPKNELKKVTSNSSATKKSKSQSKKEEVKEPPVMSQPVNVKKVNKSVEKQKPQAPQSLMEFNSMVSSILKPSGILLPSSQTGQSTKFTPDLSKAYIGTPLEKGQVIAQDSVMEDPGELRRKTSLETFKQPEPLNLLAQANLTGPQKHINRQDAIARATGGTTAQAIAVEKAQQEKKQMLQNAALGGIVGKSSNTGRTQTKVELVKDKQNKDKVSLQENSLVAFAMAEQPDLYAPNNLPFFNKNQQYEAQMPLQKVDSSLMAVNILKKTESAASAQQQRELQSSLKLMRVESTSAETTNEVKHLLLGNSEENEGKVQPRISENEPFILQLPTTLPIQSLSSQKQNTSINDLMEQLSISDSLKKDISATSEPKPFGKVLVMKSGKVILRMPSQDGNSHMDFELIKGIETNFFQELVSAHPSKKDVHFLGQINHKVIAVPDLDQIFQ